MPRTIKFKNPGYADPCPKCKQSVEFKIHSQQVAEDCCEVWAECICGFDPTAEDTGHRLEDVWGGTDDDNCIAAVSCWNDALRDQAAAPAQGEGEDG